MNEIEIALTQPRIAQSYRDPLARALLAAGLCPECSALPEGHSGDPRFWMRPGGCDLRPDGVTSRIAQYRAEVATK